MIRSKSFSTRGVIGCIAPFVGLVVALGLTPQDAHSLDLLQDDYTSVSVEGKLPYKVTSLGSPHITVGGETTEDASTSFDFTAHEPAGWTPADLHATGLADFGTLGATLDLSGGSAIEVIVVATFHDVFTVAVPSGVAPGTPATMSFVYLVDGLAQATGLPGMTPASEFSVARVTLQMTRYAPDGNSPPNPVSMPLGFDGFEVIGSQSLNGGAPPTR